MGFQVELLKEHLEEFLKKKSRATSGGTHLNCLRMPKKFK